MTIIEEVDADDQSSVIVITYIRSLFWILTLMTMILR